jgi:hypothetical protein
MKSLLNYIVFKMMPDSVGIIERAWGKTLGNPEKSTKNSVLSGLLLAVNG